MKSKKQIKKSSSKKIPGKKNSKLDKPIKLSSHKKRLSTPKVTSTIPTTVTGKKGKQKNVSKNLSKKSVSSNKLKNSSRFSSVVKSVSSVEDGIEHRIELHTIKKNNQKPKTVMYESFTPLGSKKMLPLTSSPNFLPPLLSFSKVNSSGLSQSPSDAEYDIFGFSDSSDSPIPQYLLNRYTELETDGIDNSVSKTDLADSSKKQDTQISSAASSVEAMIPFAFISNNDAKPEHHFILHGGNTLKNITELAVALSTIPEHVYMHHVNNSKNDFANWLADVFGEHDLAKKLKAAITRTEAELHVLRHLLHKVVHSKKK